jgi:hypothetical protein
LAERFDDCEHLGARAADRFEHLVPGVVRVFAQMRYDLGEVRVGDRVEPHRPCLRVPADLVLQWLACFGFAVFGFDRDDRRLAVAFPLEPGFPCALEVARAAHVVALVAGVVDEADGGVEVVAELAQVLDQRRHSRLVVLDTLGVLHPGKRVEDDEASTDGAAVVGDPLLPLAVVEADAFVGRNVEAIAEAFGVDGAAAAERVEAPPQRDLA